MTADESIFARLMAVVEDRKRNPPAKSYTTQLMAGGIDAISAKVLEESREVIEAAKEEENGGHDHLVRETADLIYHLFVLLGYCDVRLAEVEAELASRFGMSGLEEKASRPGAAAEKPLDQMP